MGEVMMEPIQVSLEKSEGLTRELKIIVAPERVQQAVNERLKELQKTVKIPGFRPGKVPENVVLQRYGKDVLYEAAADLMKEILPEAIEQQKLQPAGMPNVMPKPILVGQPLEFIASFEVFPEFPLKDLTAVNLEKVNCEIADSDVDSTIEKLRQQHVNWELAERPCQNSDRVDIDFEGFIDGVVFEGGTAKNFSLELGKGNMIPGFEDGILGAKAGEVREVHVTFPEDYHGKDVAGKAAIFKINVNKVEQPMLPELNAEFAEKFNVKEGGIDKLREEVKHNLEHDLEHRLFTINKNRVFSELVKLNSFELPNAMVQQEIQGMQHYFAKQMGASKKQLPDLPIELFKSEAERRVKLGIIIRALVNKHEVKADQEAIKHKVMHMAEHYHDPREFINHYMQNRQLLAEVEQSVIEDKIVDLMLQQATINEKVLSYETVLNYKEDQAGDE